MLSTAIVIFRESLEISLIMGIVLAATRDLPGRLFWILGGIGAGIAGAGAVAYFADEISKAASGMGQEFFNAGILFTAAMFIGWTILWMRKHVREMSAKLKQVGIAVTEGNLPKYSLSVIIALAMLREGSEIVLFMYGMIASGETATGIISGSLLGLLLGTASGVAFYAGLIRIPDSDLDFLTGGNDELFRREFMVLERKNVIIGICAACHKQRRTADDYCKTFVNHLTFFYVPAWRLRSCNPSPATEMGQNWRR